MVLKCGRMQAHLRAACRTCGTADDAPHPSQNLDRFAPQHIHAQNVAALCSPRRFPRSALSELCLRRVPARVDHLDASSVGSQQMGDDQA